MINYDTGHHTATDLPADTWDPDPSSAQGRRLPTWATIAGTLALVGVVAASGFIGSHLRVERVGGQTPTPYTSVAGYLDTITAQETAAQWQMATNNAETAVGLGGFSPTDTQLLKQHAIADALRAIQAEPFPAADVNAQQQAVDAYESVVRRAQDYGVPVESPRAVAEDAYNTGHFLLAKTAFEVALAHGDISLADQLQVQFYCSTLFDLGKWYAEDGANAAVRAQGLRLLSASYAIDNQYQIGSGAAWGELTKLLGSNAWPAPAPTPLLGTGSPSTTEVTNGSPQ